MSNRFAVVAVCWLVAPTLGSAGELLFPNSDFEQGTLDGWTVTGEAFRVQPTKGDNTAARNRESCNLQGDWWIGGYEKYNGVVGEPGATAGDRLTGTLTSREFEVRQPYLTFRIGAGNLPGEVGVRLLVGDESVDLGTGINSETMINMSADVRDYLGQTARLQIFDAATGGWGHINVDDFRGSDEPVRDTSKDFQFTEGISASGYPDVGYAQSNRPQFHFCSRKNWLNDPNGMVFDGERYHLFFQHNPKGTSWGNMTWGHATSLDMIHWIQLDHALLPYRVDRNAGTIFSGTAVVDHNNSLGRQVGETKTLCAFFTFAAKPAFYQAMAFSTDGGATWDYWNEGRAVVPNQGFDNGERDPKVFWHDESGQWVMVLWVERNPGRVRWFTSDNLVDWTFASDLMVDWAFECMDVVFLPVDGDVDRTKCVIYDASFDYEIGTFDGRAFHTESKPLKQGRGNFYAAQTFNQSPDGRIVQIGWMRGGPNSADHFDVPHNQQMSFPYELSLRSTDDGPRLFCEPIDEIESLVADRVVVQDVELKEGVNAVPDVESLDLVDMLVTFEPGDAEAIVFELPRVSVRYDAVQKRLVHTGVEKDATTKEMITLDRVTPRDGKITLRFLVDRLSLEAFAFDGERFGAHYIDPRHDNRQPAIRAVGGSGRIDRLEIRRLKSAWSR